MTVTQTICTWPSRARTFRHSGGVFRTTGGIGSGREFWWDELEQLILGQGARSEIAFTVGNLLYSWNTKTGETTGPVGDPQPWWPAGDSAALRVYRSCHYVLQSMEDADRAAAMNAMAKDSARCSRGARVTSPA